MSSSDNWFWIFFAKLWEHYIKWTSCIIDVWDFYLWWMYRKQQIQKCRQDHKYRMKELDVQLELIKLELELEHKRIEIFNKKICIKAKSIVRMISILFFSITTNTWLTVWLLLHSVAFIETMKFIKIKNRIRAMPCPGYNKQMIWKNITDRCSRLMKLCH